jgi:2'-5' RNA ligase
MTDSRFNNAFVFRPVTLSRDEAYALLTEDAAGVLFPPADTLVASANPSAHTGAMVALVPSDADLERLAMEDGEPLEELHLTLAYLGEADAISEELRMKIVTACTQYFNSPVVTEAFSVNVFNPHNPDMETAVVLGIKGEELVEPQGNVMSAVRGAYAGMPDNHKPWIPHVTLKYTSDPKGEDQQEYVSRLGPITFDKIRFAFGGEVTDIQLGGDEVLTAAVSRMPRQLKKYWLGPEGSARVGGWGNKGSFTRCQQAMREEGVDTDEIDGLCANLYRAATGKHPGRKKDVTTASVTISNSDVMELEAPVESATLVEWDGVLTLEGLESGDGRMFKFGSLDWAPLPLKLMYQPANTGGHSNSVLVGQITHVYRDGNQIMGRGIIDLEAKTAEGYAIGREVYRLMSESYLNGVSVDVDKVKDADVELKYSTEAPGPFDKPTMTVFNRGRIRGATLVAFPAFVEASIHLTGEVLTASAVGEVLTMTDCGCDGQPLTAASHTITIPDVPPAWWFSEPTDVEIKGALTITDEGRVFGQLAPKGVTHRSVKRQVPAKVDYSRFMGAETLVAGADGQIHRVVSGPITFNCGHASTDPLEYGTLENRRNHYDNSCSVFADIAIGEDKDGNVWVAGAVKPWATGEQIQQAMSCRLSGDWQPHPDRAGVNEFIAALLVPVPGFATARKEASVTVRDGALVSSVVPVEFVDNGLLTAAYRKKQIYRKRVGSFAERHKLELAQRMGRFKNV